MLLLPGELLVLLFELGDDLVSFLGALGVRLDLLLHIDNFSMKFVSLTMLVILLQRSL
jgi:hypothetical protein